MGCGFCTPLQQATQPGRGVLCGWVWRPEGLGVLVKQREVLGKGVQALTGDEEGHQGETLDRKLGGGRSGE